ncbi:DUF305 domain-containing protein [Pedobacter nutrimenti]|uniref:Uncharacterized protein (DUF305 family) n=1 Tax=Pedobacter nutrimenti TaxID=1241337 RepID=A0A318UGQ7_9SPHI|nr:DUF305 domain-containing protein [Pedobacter nutrimenti]PYF74680.1 uncharacterized protein (DUF305 family) [Pedobacter nutrimenti]
MKNRLIMPLIAIAAIVASCQNQQSNNQNDSVANADSSGHAMSDTSSNMKDSPIMVSMNKMMENMHKMEKSGNADHDLAASLHEHHMGAIDMAEAELQNGSDDKLKKMAQAIKEKQGKEIQDLDGLIAKYKNAAKNYDPTNLDKGLGKATSDDMMAMMAMPKEKAITVDQQFVMMMSKHHADGLKMGNTILQFAKDPMFKSMATKMVADQTKEIKEFENWQVQHHR